ncbi:unnamed protein product (macronuclear) [Paramecium tetraurelia]|uniref:Uncharacterized protein n=1 Tax=Paramecium tetraurelia TaxID=5888 RepID=A0CLF1_PARTE|nr:uncharacterized protein GSPATT00008166001 [Paramecium tetraurelia]CAK71618.1 unnamed protein product [Paramecium tetraurelia]|eukprot:XP_001439015.1 hypothetical protein (macronuclear) [Paramecium tetraurelia strain d4-2]
MNKIIILSLMTAYVVANNQSYYRRCSKAVCAVPYQTCQNDVACQQTFAICEEQCSSGQENCIETCLLSSNSLTVQRLALCSLNNMCMNSMDCKADITCPATCKEPVKLGNDKCSTPSTYASQECISDFLIQIGRDECADRLCVCKTGGSLEVFITGCYC